MARTAKSKASPILIERLSAEQIQSLHIPEKPMPHGPWNVWECGPSAFNWHYDQEEKAFFYEGEVNVITPREEVTIRKGDFVTFPKGLSCRWEVHQKVRKVYKFE